MHACDRSHDDKQIRIKGRGRGRGRLKMQFVLSSVTANRATFVTAMNKRRIAEVNLKIDGVAAMKLN